MRVVTILGTRPEMIKLWSTIKCLDSIPGIDHTLIHTGQNFTPELKDFFFSDLEFRPADFNLDIDVSNYGVEVADVIAKSYQVFKKIKPDALLILGDTYSGLSVLPATNLGIKTFHMEAGLRAWDRRMPEQRNRILIDHISSILLPFHQYHRENLLREGIHPSKIIVSGNPTFEVMDYYQTSIEQSKCLERLHLEPKRYILVTAHRSENVDDPKTFLHICQALKRLKSETGLEIVYPMHPRAHSRLAQEHNLNDVMIIKPLGFYDFNKLVKNCCCILSDSGTAAEEAIYYGVPGINLRQTTERYETLESGNTVVSGTEADQIVAATKMAMASGTKTSGVRYDLNEGFRPSQVVVNAILSNITNHF